MSSVNLRGLHLHLGSPIYESDPYVLGLEKAAELKKALAQESIEIDTINLGGGYPMSYTGEEVLPPSAYAKAVKPLLTELKLNLILEPGRHIAAPSGILVVKILYRKETDAGRKFLIIDGAMNDLIRPSMYDAFHRIWPTGHSVGMPGVISPDDRALEGFDTEIVDVVGPVCESGDSMAKERPLPVAGEGDLLAIFDAGAYGSTMGSNYNGRPRPAEIVIDERGPYIASRRETYPDLIKRENLTAI